MERINRRLRNNVICMRNMAFDDVAFAQIHRVQVIKAIIQPIIQADNRQSESRSTKRVGDCDSVEEIVKEYLGWR